MAKKPDPTPTAAASDSVEAEVIKGPGTPKPIFVADLTRDESDPGEAPGVTQTLDDLAGAPQSHLGMPVSLITDAETAAQVLKSKISLLHTIGHNMGHFATLAFEDVEALIADIKFLVNFIRSKV